MSVRCSSHQGFHARHPSRCMSIGDLIILPIFYNHAHVPIYFTECFWPHLMVLSNSNYLQRVLLPGSSILM